MIMRAALLLSLGCLAFSASSLPQSSANNGQLVLGGQIDKIASADFHVEESCSADGLCKAYVQLANPQLIPGDLTRRPCQFVGHAPNSTINYTIFRDNPLVLFNWFLEKWCYYGWAMSYYGSQFELSPVAKLAQLKDESGFIFAFALSFRLAMETSNAVIQIFPGGYPSTLVNLNITRFHAQ